MAKVYLHGKLGSLFGREWELDVSSPAEAFRALDVNLKGKLRQYFGGEGAKKLYRIALQSKTNVLSQDELTHRSGSSSIHVIPTLKGSSGAVKAIVGAVIIGLMWWNPGGWMAAAGLATAGGTLTVGGMFVASIAGSLLLGGVTELLTPKAKSNDAQQAQSSTFQGNAAVALQGAAIPVVYGRMLVSPTPVCVSQSSSPTSTTNAGRVGTVEEYGLEDGGWQYVPGSRGGLAGNIYDGLYETGVFD